jgi:hypothetical protein
MRLLGHNVSVLFIDKGMRLEIVTDLMQMLSFVMNSRRVVMILPSRRFALRFSWNCLVGL